MVRPIYGAHPLNVEPIRTVSEKTPIRFPDFLNRNNGNNRNSSCTRRLFWFLAAVFLFVIILGLNHDENTPLGSMKNNLVTKSAAAILLNSRQTFSKVARLRTADSEIKVGKTPGYELAAENLKLTVDLTTDPCIDFYQFSCGNYKKNHPMASHLTSMAPSLILREKVTKAMQDFYEDGEKYSSKAINDLKLYYNTCMDQKSINKHGPRTLLKELETLGYWPMVHGEKWNAETFDLSNLLIAMGGARGVKPFVYFRVETDKKNSSRRYFVFDEANLTFGSREELLAPQNHTKALKATKEYAFKRIRQITLDAGLVFNENKALSDLEELIALETSLAKLHPTPMERNDVEARYNIRKLEELDILMPEIDWKKLLRASTPPVIHEYLSTNPEVIIENAGYIKKVSALLSKKDSRVLANYVLYRYARTYEDIELGSVYEDISAEWTAKRYGQTERTPRSQQCISKASGMAKYAHSAVYVKKYFKKDAKQAVLDIVAHLKSALQEMIRVSTWMDESTKQKAIEKSAAMITHMGYPDWIVDDANLDEYYKDLNISPSDGFNEICSKTNRFHKALGYKKLLEIVDRNKFPLGSTMVNAFYNAQMNSITFPAAFLQAPFFHPSQPKALNYGSIGCAIGHEITHGFDDHGRQFDAKGDHSNWWDADTLKNYEKRTECMRVQYGNVKISEISMNINGNLTLGENIADNGGIREAYMAYQQYLLKNGNEPRIPGFEKYDNDQMFFIGYAQNWCSYQTPEVQKRMIKRDSHAPSKARVNVVLQNQPSFSEVFHCKPNSPMNPAKKCTVW